MKTIIKKIARMVSDLKAKYAGSWFGGLRLKHKAIVVWASLSLVAMCSEVDLSSPGWWLQILALASFAASAWCLRYVPMEDGEDEA